MQVEEVEGNVVWGGYIIDDRPNALHVRLFFDYTTLIFLKSLGEDQKTCFAESFPCLLLTEICDELFAV